MNGPADISKSEDILKMIDTLFEEKLVRERLFREDFTHRVMAEMEARILDKLEKRLQRLPVSFPAGGKVMIHTIDGQRLYLDPNEPFMTLHLIEHGAWENHVRKAIGSLLAPGAVYLDVGANTGVHVLYAAQVVGAEGRIIAVEPHPVTRRFLHDNLEINGLLERVTIVPEAVTDKAGELVDFDYFVQHPAMSGLRVHETALAKFQGKVERIKVATQTIDAILAKAQTPADLVKIDVEGFEVMVILGATQTIARDTDTCFLIEHEQGNARAVYGGDPTKALFGFFQERGFECLRLASDERARRVEYARMPEYNAGDYLFVRPGSKHYRNAMDLL